MVGKRPACYVQRRASVTEDRHRWRRTVGGICEDFPGVLHSRFSWNLKENKQTSVLAAYEKALSSDQGHWSILPILTGDIPGVSPCPRPDKHMKTRWIIHRQQTFINHTEQGHFVLLSTVCGGFWISLLPTVLHMGQRRSVQTSASI